VSSTDSSGTFAKYVTSWSCRLVPACVKARVATPAEIRRSWSRAWPRWRSWSAKRLRGPATTREPGTSFFSEPGAVFSDVACVPPSLHVVFPFELALEKSFGRRSFVLWSIDKGVKRVGRPSRPVLESASSCQLFYSGRDSADATACLHAQLVASTAVCGNRCTG
jgi:hypothetical protein